MTKKINKKVSRNLLTNKYLCAIIKTQRERAKEIITMAKAIGPIYAVVAMQKVMTEPQDMWVYSKQSSNKEAMIAYAREIQARYPHKRVVLMTREKANEQQRKFYLWRKEQERAKLERCDRNLNKLLGRMVYADSTKRVAER